MSRPHLHLIDVLELVPHAAAPATAEQGVALVIGNTDYSKISKLKIPGNDAVVMMRTLKAAGFEVILAIDVDIRGMR